VTATILSRGWKSFRLNSFLPLIMALACVVLWGSMFLRISDRNIGIDKDWLYHYLCGLETVHPALHEQQIELARDVVSASTNDQVVYRATLRANYCNNYPFTSLSLYLAGKWQTYFGVGPTQDFATFLSRTLWSGVIVSGELLGILCLLVTFYVTKGVVRLSIFMTVGLCALCYLIIPPPYMNWMFYQLSPVPPSPRVNWINISEIGLRSWFNPGAAYSPFSVFTRCSVAMLSFTAFAIRWADRPAAAYWMPLLVSGVHQSSAIILLFALICCDIVIRPQIFRRASCLIPIGMCLSVIFLRERMFSILGFSLSRVMIIAAIVVGLVLVIAALKPVREAVRAGWSYLEEWRGRTIAVVPLPLADALILFAMWFVLLLISYFASRNDAWYRVIYFWSELSPRYVGMFQLSVGAGVIYPLVATMQSARPATERVVTVCFAVLMLIGAVSQLAVERDGISSAIRVARRYEESSLRKDVYLGSTRPEMSDETTWCYLLVRNAILGDRSISSFFGKT
jgi:hypothetical protein